MTKFLDFNGSLINPDQVYKITRVTDTVTFTLRMVGMGSGNIFEEDFVFGSEAEAITALDAFVADSKALTLEEAICCVTTGALANATITANALKNTNLGDINDRVEVMVGGIIDVAEELVLQYEAL